MKYFVRMLLPLVLLALLLTGCNDPDQPTETELVTYTVQFNSNGGSAVPSQTVKEGGKAASPEDPVRENYIFDGWQRGGKKWTFSYDSVNENVTLEAVWISADYVFEYQAIEGSDSAYVTALKSEHTTIVVPTAINGFRVLGLGEGIFAELSSDTVKKIIVPDSVTEVGAEAFADAKGITVIFEGTLSAVGERAFLNCDGLTGIRLAEGVSRITTEAFMGSGLKTLIAPSTVTVIEESAFQNCASLQTVVLYGTMAQNGATYVVEDSAFRDCTALKTVFLYGTEADRTALLNKTDAQNQPLSKATFCYYSELEPTAEGDYWYMHDGKPRVW